MAMRLKLDDDGNAIVNDGMPVYVGDDGKDIDVDVPQLFQKVTELSAESKAHREKAKAALEKLKVFDGIEDLEEYRRTAEDAIEKVKNFTDKELVEAGKVEQIKSEMKQAHEQRIQEMNQSFEEAKSQYEGTINKKDSIIYNLMVSSKFSQSPFFTGEKPKTNLPPEIGEAYFGHHFKVVPNQNGDLRVVAYMSDGKEIYSRKIPGELADFDEALEMIIDNYPKKNQILQAGRSGGGGTGGGGGNHESEDELDVLQSQYEEATKSGDMKAAISIKNRIFDLRSKK